MTDAPVDEDDYAGLKGRFYRWYIRRPRLGRVVGATLWGSDFRPLYRHLSGLAALPGGTTVLDAACGAGLTLEWLDPANGHRYVGVDLSPSMLDQARRRAAHRGLPAELYLADVGAIPLADGAAEVGLFYNALHCVPDPQAAVAEVVRCLTPGGRLLGASLVRGGSPRADRLLGLDPTMGPGGTLADLGRWLADVGMGDIELNASGAMAVFSATKAEVTTLRRSPAPVARPPAAPAAPAYHWS